MRLGTVRVSRCRFIGGQRVASVHGEAALLRGGAAIDVGAKAARRPADRGAGARGRTGSERRRRKRGHRGAEHRQRAPCVRRAGPRRGRMHGAAADVRGACSCAVCEPRCGSVSDPAGAALGLCAAHRNTVLLDTDNRGDRRVRRPDRRSGPWRIRPNVRPAVMHERQRLLPQAQRARAGKPAAARRRGMGQRDLD